jgi:ABC-type multidrug transport system ATPase subunit
MCCAGCGKTTLLSILAGSVSSLSASSHVCGNITLDGQPRKSWASRLVAYVPQFDFLLPTLTVAETLRYSALLRLPRDASGHEVQVRSGTTVTNKQGSACSVAHGGPLVKALGMPRS